MLYCQILNTDHIFMSCLTYITGFVEKISGLLVFCQLRKKGGWTWKIIKLSTPQKPLGQFTPNMAWKVLGWSPLKIVSGIAVRLPKWPLWPLIGWNSNRYNLFILSAILSNFEHRSHNYELFIIYYGFWRNILGFAVFANYEKKGGGIISLMF